MTILNVAFVSPSSQEPSYFFPAVGTKQDRGLLRIKTNFGAGLGSVT